MDSKYHNKKCRIYGKEFDSIREGERYMLLYSWEKQGKIKDLKLQVPFELIPKQINEDGKMIAGCRYIADFTYTDSNGKFIVEDAKGMRTDVYRLKAKLMLMVHGITVHEV